MTTRTRTWTWTKMSWTPWKSSCRRPQWAEAGVALPPPVCLLASLLWSESCGPGGAAALASRAQFFWLLGLSFLSGASSERPWGFSRCLVGVSAARSRCLPLELAGSAAVSGSANADVCGSAGLLVSCKRCRAATFCSSASSRACTAVVGLAHLAAP